MKNNMIAASLLGAAAIAAIGVGGLTTSDDSLAQVAQPAIVQIAQGPYDDDGSSGNLGYAGPDNGVHGPGFMPKQVTGPGVAGGR